MLIFQANCLFFPDIHSNHERITHIALFKERIAHGCSLKWAILSERVKSKRAKSQPWVLIAYSLLIFKFSFRFWRRDIFLHYNTEALTVIALSLSRCEKLSHAQHWRVHLDNIPLISLLSRRVVKQNIFLNAMLYFFGLFKISSCMQAAFSRESGR